MKFFAWFLSLNILMITCITCEDISEPSLLAKNHISSTVTKGQDQTNNDNCSPLCTCNCCGQPLVFLERLITSGVAKSETCKLNEPEYENKFAAGFLTNIWQPPKLPLNSIG